MMQYKVIHSADLQKDLDEAAAGGWELFDMPQPYRSPGTAAQYLLVMERGESMILLPSSPDAEANGITLATIRSWAESQPTQVLGGVGEHGRGYASAVRDVRSILAAHGKDPLAPVHFGS